jgi:hypothetical protein
MSWFGLTRERQEYFPRPVYPEMTPVVVLPKLSSTSLGRQSSETPSSFSQEARKTDRPL